jgi:hypothetical protein
VGNERVRAVGWERQIPAPDPIARDYLLLALRLDRLIPGLIDSYFGPADLKAKVDAEPPMAPARLREQASALQSRLAIEAGEPSRVLWLRAQLVSLEAQAMILAGDPLPYSERVACFFDISPERPSDVVFDSAADDLARLLPLGQEAGEPLSARLRVWESRFAIDPTRLPTVTDWLVGEIRERTDRLLGLPTGEAVTVFFVQGRQWGVSSHYEGACRSRVEVNSDLLRTPVDMIQMAAHQCYPGRHTELAWRESGLLEGLGFLEASVVLLNTPEALISEGMAYQGERLVAADEDLPGLLLELYGRGGLAIAADPVAAMEAAEIEVRIKRAVASLRAVPANAAFMLHADGVPRDEVALYLRHRMVAERDRADMQMKAIEDPIYRTQVVAAYQGERLMHNWFELGPRSERVDRFGRFMREQLTPGSLSSELSSIGFGEGHW